MDGMAGKTLGLRLFAVAFFLAWTLFTLYPRPTDLVRSVYRVFNPPVDAEYAAAFSHVFTDTDLNDTVAIEAGVKEAFPYQYDWVTYNVPWYFPTVEEAFERMAGDCKTQLLVLASMLEARGIPYTISVSPTHVWVEYEGKRTNRIENAQVAMFTAPGAGGTPGGSSLSDLFRMPAELDLARSFEVFWIAFWHHMPADRKVSLAVGLMISLVLFAIAGTRIPEVTVVSPLPAPRRAVHLR